jgi:hypothetical protein
MTSSHGDESCDPSFGRGEFRSSSLSAREEEGHVPLTPNSICVSRDVNAGDIELRSTSEGT